MAHCRLSSPRRAQLALLQAATSPHEYLVTQLGFRAPEARELASDYGALSGLDLARMHANVQALRGLGRSLEDIKALVLTCPPVLEVHVEAFLTFFDNYGATSEVRRSPRRDRAILLHPHSLPYAGIKHAIFMCHVRAGRLEPWMRSRV